eukprot:GHVU01077297.1.p1 GENE.GHVU01077297.1~~GHVU01077297.1.p1  ORF type:complete len:501 (-),score=100.93 GHVU01077297.1:186-1643(-)
MQSPPSPSKSAAVRGEVTSALHTKHDEATGRSYYAHVSDLVSALLEESPKAKVYEALTRICSRLARLEGRESGGGGEDSNNNIILEAGMSEQILSAAYSSENENKFSPIPLKRKHITTLQRLLPTANNAAAGEEGARTSTTQLADPRAQLQALQWANVGFGSHDTFFIDAAVKHLASSVEGYSSIRLWGKVLAQRQDYWIAEGSPEPGAAGNQENADEDEEDRSEPYGQGANRYAYWAAPSSAPDQWVRLPEVKSKLVPVARELAKILYGDLTRAVISHPPFDGTEADLLRANISIITAETTVCPVGQFSVEDTYIVPTEDFSLPRPSDCAELDQWIYAREPIGQDGRVIPEDDEDTDGDVDTSEWLASIADVEEDETPRWSIETPPVVGGCGSFGEWDASIVILRSIRWPGAATVLEHGGCHSIYVGDLRRHGAQPFYPPAPASVQSEPPELEEQDFSEKADSDGGSEEEEEGGEAESEDSDED